MVAYNLAKTCVVGCSKLICDEENRQGMLKDVILKTGDYISIDGQNGLVYKGRIPVREI